MKNIQVIDAAENCVYDIFAATPAEFALIFKKGQDIAFNEDIWKRSDEKKLQAAFERIWERPVDKKKVRGIHGTLFYQLLHKKKYYPTLKDSEAVNPNGSRLR